MVDPVTVPNLPAGHWPSHVASLCALKRPAAQRLQCDAPVCAGVSPADELVKCPGTQKSHVLSPSPLNRPAGQALQWLAPVRTPSPSASAALSAVKLPGAHVAQAPLLALLKVPTGQALYGQALTGVVSPVAVPYQPSTQAMQASVLPAADAVGW